MMPSSKGRLKSLSKEPEQSWGQQFSSEYEVNPGYLTRLPPLCVRKHNGARFERYSERARRVVFIAVWAARERGGSHIEREDLLEALIREDRGEFTASAETCPGSLLIEEGNGGRQSFFSKEVAQKLLQALDQPRNRDEATKGDMPISESLKQALKIAAKIACDTESTTIEPLHLLAAIVERRDSRIAQLLGEQGITREGVAQTLDPHASE